MQEMSWIAMTRSVLVNAFNTFKHISKNYIFRGGQPAIERRTSASAEEQARTGEAELE